MKWWVRVEANWYGAYADVDEAEQDAYLLSSPPGTTTHPDVYVVHGSLGKEGTCKSSFFQGQRQSESFEIDIPTQAGGWPEL
jgi:hypothetical protein